MSKITEFDKNDMISTLLAYHSVMCAVEDRVVEIAKSFNRVDDNWRAVETGFETIDDIYCVCSVMARDDDSTNLTTFKCPVAWLYSDTFDGPLYSKIYRGEL